MSWLQIDWKNVKPMSNLLPEGKYRFRLLGGSYDGRDPGRVNLDLAVSEGPFTNRRLFDFSYPDPVKEEWSSMEFSRLQEALDDALDLGTDPVEYLQRNVGKEFEAKVFHQKDKNGVYPDKARIRHASVKRPSQ